MERLFEVYSCLLSLNTFCSDENTWEPVENVINCPLLIQAYERSKSATTTKVSNKENTVPIDTSSSSTAEVITPVVTNNTDESSEAPISTQQRRGRPPKKSLSSTPKLPDIVVNAYLEYDCANLISDGCCGK